MCCPLTILLTYSPDLPQKLIATVALVSSYGTDYPVLSTESDLATGRACEWWALDH